MSASTTRERPLGATSLLTEALLEQLPAIAQGMYRSLSSLGNSPTPETCQVVAIQLAGAHRYCLTLAQAIQADKDGVTHKGWLGQFITGTLPASGGEGDA